MKEIVINCASLSDAPSLHRCLADALDFPEWYGNNLDALHDCLSEISGDTRLTLLEFDCLGAFRAGFRVVLNAAEEENPHLFVYIQ